ncbi:cytochrome C oxidase subunit III [Skermanella stibiiresistens SB22]|uniref:Cytochrome C oxidase subunit III n=1 Tax=Skermanella stibiiresistens SB22 TaxID=1385369 RepID=W9GQA6_9PROT|nr:cytochrome P460 family protein [Skermanella stibiiresistens]EWY36095.1 cytochrome C oxidase subunit III [Skermanella stibiiresistens SB22]
MKRRFAGATGIAVAIAVAVGCVEVDEVRAQDAKDVSPLYGVAVPDGYRKWELVAPALEDDPLNELRAVVGNTVAMEAYRSGTLPFPDGTVLVKLAWKRAQSAEFGTATVPGAATTVQVMVKDSGRYAATGGWGFGRFIDGKPVDEAQHETCFACHDARVQGHDYVFTRYAP